MSQKTSSLHRAGRLAAAALLIVSLVAAAGVGAVGPGQAGFPTNPTLRITAVDASRLPQIELRALGRNADGTPLDFAGASLIVNHGSEQINQITVAGQQDVGTLAIFLLDTPAGVEDQLALIQAAVSNYATDAFMREQLDYVAIYQVGSLGAQQLLEPTQFFNTITNFLLDPLPTPSGPTALLDSIGALLSEIDTLKPDPALDTVLVVVSDGTDVISTQFNEGQIYERALALGVPIHTIHIDNPALVGADEGSRFMTTIAQVTGGIDKPLSGGGIEDIWERIGQFRAQTLLRYSLAEPAAGEQVPIVLSLADNPEAQAGAAVAISPAAGLLTLEIPVESRAITVPDLSEPIELRLPAAVRWIDGEERELTALQLWSNGVPIADLNPGSVSEFEAAFANWRLGTNEIWLTAADSSGREMASPIIPLTVVQGETLAIPEIMQPAGVSLWTWLLGCLAGLFLAGGLVWWLFLRGSGGVRFDPLRNFPRGGGRRGRRRSRPGARPTSGQSSGGQIVSGDDPDGVPSGFALDVVEALTRFAAPIGLRAYELQLGRSPGQANIVFEQDATVSRLHASLIREGNSYRLFDEGSTSGTYVNGQPVPDYGSLLIDGDEIQLGAVRLRFRVV